MNKRIVEDTKQTLMIKCIGALKVAHVISYNVLQTKRCAAFSYALSNTSIIHRMSTLKLFSGSSTFIQPLPHSYSHTHSIKKKITKTTANVFNTTGEQWLFCCSQNGNRWTSRIVWWAGVYDGLIRLTTTWISVVCRQVSSSNSPTITHITYSSIIRLNTYYELFIFSIASKKAKKENKLKSLFDVHTKARKARNGNVAATAKQKSKSPKCYSTLLKNPFTFIYRWLIYFTQKQPKMVRQG